MKCPKCKFENPEGSKFCNECGRKMLIVCPSCQSVNQPGSKFCGECGQSLAVRAIPEAAPSRELSFEEKLQKIQKYLPGGLTEKILSQRGKIEGEHRQVTVLFADMENFSQLTEKLGPEEAYTIMDQVYEILIHKVHDFEGTVNEMTGDGVMALFGAPIALEDAPQRAIRSALAIHQEIARFSDRMKQDRNILPIKMRIGIHTGPVIVGTMGNDLRVEFKAVGDTVNLASMIQNLAAAGTTCVSEDAFKLTEGLFRFESLGQKEIKGKEQPVPVYQVIAPSSSRTRFDVNAEKGLTAFVGRSRELENLLDGLDRVKAGRGQVFSLIGEAGVGKSRLLYEFRKAVTNDAVTFLEGKCLSYGRGSAYHPIIDILRATFNIQTGDSEQNIREKLTDALKTLNINVEVSLPFLLELLSVKDSGMEKISMSPEGKKDRMIETIKQLIVKYAELQPLIIAIEDLHWVDKSTEDALKYILEVVPGSRILLIFTYRPEYVHPWDRKSYHNQLALNRLSNRESLVMATSLLDNAPLDTGLEELILSRTEGIPFFIEEHIKSLKDLGIIERRNGFYKLAKDIKAIMVPSTIQDVIMARVDALPEGAKEIIRTGSVIEREFSHELLKKVTVLPENELLSSISFLKEAELIYERGIYPDVTYIFKHALTREVVYNSILLKTKKQIHEKIGKAIEKINERENHECYGVLANHFMAGEDYEKAAEYFRLEARKHQRAASLRDAVAYAKNSITCLERLPRNEAVKKRIVDARVKLSLYYLSLNYYIKAKEAVEPAITLAQELNYVKRLSGIYTAMGIYYIYIEEDFFKGKQYLNYVFKIAPKTEDFSTVWLANIILGHSLCYDQQFDEGRSYLQSALDLSVSSNNLSSIASSKTALALCYNFQGKADEALQMSTEALESAKDYGDIVTLQSAFSSQGMSCYYKGHFLEAEENLLEGMRLYEKASLLSWGSLAATYLGFVYSDIGEYGKIEEYCKKNLLIFEDAKFWPSWINVSKLFFARSKILNHDSDIDLRDLNNLIATQEKNGLGIGKSWGARFIGEIYLNIDSQHMREADAWIKRAIEVNTRYDNLWELARDYVLYADWFKKGNDAFAAKEQMTKAIGIFNKCGSDGWVEKCEKELALL